MNTIIMLIIALVAFAQANTYVCGYDSNKDVTSQIESCKLQILRETCEQKGMQIWSKTTVTNNTLDADQIKTDASCNTIGLHISNMKFTDSTLIIEYTQAETAQEVRSVSMEQWGSIKQVTHKTDAKVTKVQRPDSTTLADLAVSIQIDSREIKQKLKKIEDKTNRILEIMME